MTTLAALEGLFARVFEPMEDHTKNGLQVQGRDEVRKVLFAVSQSELLFEEAVRCGADAIFVHHGFFGKGYIDITGPLQRKLSLLLKHGISLFAYHLPLDAHPEYGHNAQLALHAGLERHERLECGYVCDNPMGLSVEQISDNTATYLNREQPYRLAVEATAPAQPLLPTARDGNLVYSFGPSVPKRVFVCSGGSASFMPAAIGAGCDLMILGEIQEHHVVYAHENRLSLVVLGHWRSERCGIWKMMEVVHGELGVPCEYCGIANCQ